MRKLVSYHALTWDRANQSGRLVLTFEDRSKLDLAALTLAEMTLFSQILHNEQPVYFDEETSVLSAGEETGRR
jgi:hypothetical protein